MAASRRELSDRDETARFGRDLAAVLRPGDVVLLDGPLGAGKTTLVRSLAAALGADPALVASPTFVVVNVYPVAGGADVVHADAYRLGGELEEELEQLGWDGLVGPGRGTVTLIEWGERVAGLLEDAPARVRLEPTGALSRRATIDLPESWAGRAGVAALAGAASPPPPREDTVCPVTGRRVPADSPTWPFADDRARMADLHRWFSEGYTVSRPLEQADLEQDD